jgi:hypothetical protein
MSSPATTPATQPPKAPEAPAPVKRSLASRVLTRPEIGAVAAAIAIFIFFYAIAPAFRTLPSFATVLYASSTIGIVAVGVALLMIGGEFDLSSGVSVVTSALAAALLTFQLSLNIWVGVFASLIVGLGIGFINGYLVVKTKIPQLPDHPVHVLHAPRHQPRRHQGRHRHRGQRQRLRADGFLAAKVLFASDVPLGIITVKSPCCGGCVRRDRLVDHAAHQGRQLDLRCRRNAGQRPRGRRPGAQGEDRAVHGRGFPGLVLRHAPAVQLLLGAVRAGHRQRVHLHHRRGGRWLPADRRLRLRGRLRARRVHLRHDHPGHRVRRVRPELVLHLPGRDAAARGAGQPYIKNYASTRR